jgi:hypothetical protein
VKKRKYLYVGEDETSIDLENGEEIKRYAKNIRIQVKK